MRVVVDVVFLGVDEDGVVGCAGGAIACGVLIAPGWSTVVLRSSVTCVSTATLVLILGSGVGLLPRNMPPPGPLVLDSSGGGAVSSFAGGPLAAGRLASDFGRLVRVEAGAFEKTPDESWGNVWVPETWLLSSVALKE